MEIVNDESPGSFDGSFFIWLLLVVTALTELVAGMALISAPSASMVFLTGSALSSRSGMTIARICGAALISLGIACGKARDDIHSPATKGIVLSMLFYDIAAVVILSYAGIGLQMQGLLLWPGVTLHALMTVWCLFCLRYKPIIDELHQVSTGSSSIHMSSSIHLE